MGRKLFYFNTLNIYDHLRKGNHTYLRCFEIYFTRNYIIYCNSEKNVVFRKGKTIYIGFGFSKYIYINVLLSPFALYKLFKRIKPDICVTTDIVYSFWSSIFIRFMKEYFLYPVCFVDKILKSSICEFLPYKVLEKFLIRLSFLAAPKVCFFPGMGYDEFIEETWYIKNKLVYPKNIVEEYPTMEFMQEILRVHSMPSTFLNRKSIKLVTVGRLYRHKLFDQAIMAVKILVDKGITVDFYIIGDGPELRSLKKLASNLKIDNYVHFLGAIPNQDLVPYFQSVDLYISTLTGTSLREAILCEVPAVTFNNPMHRTYFDEFGSIGYITQENTPQALAEGVVWFFNNKDQHQQIKRNIKKLKEKWNLKNLEKSLHETFDKYIAQ